MRPALFSWFFLGLHRDLDLTFLFGDSRVVLLRIGRLRRGLNRGLALNHSGWRCCYLDPRLEFFFGTIFYFRGLQRHLAATLLIFKRNGPCLGLIDLRGAGGRRPDRLHCSNSHLSRL
jgi:hypothetical protein